MSTLCAFFGIDDKPSGQVGYASAYLASDSYITDQNGKVMQSDSQKVFASMNVPATLGYVGDTRIALLLEETVRQLDAPHSLFAGSYGSSARAHVLGTFFANNLSEEACLICESIVIYVGRTYGESGNQSKFHIWQFTRPQNACWTSEELNVPSRSGPPVLHGRNVGFWGSGGPLLSYLERYKNYQDFSWAYFRELVRALREGQDRRSGGTVQLAFLPRGGNGGYVGVIEKGEKFVCGKRLSDLSPRVSRWVDDNFDECDPNTLQRRPDRKRSPIV